MRVTYFPVETQKRFLENRERVRGKPYAKYFDGDLFIDEEAARLVSSGPMPEHLALQSAPDALNTLLDRGYHEGETGYCALADGTAYTASLTRWPGCTGEMVRWWFWWHSVEPERYVLWYPHCHISAQALNREVLTRTGLTAEQRYIGNTHRITEYIGAQSRNFLITFVEPQELGFDIARFAEADIVAHVCGLVSLQRPRVPFALMVHLVRETAGGVEMRSRYWIGNSLTLKLFGKDVAIDRPMARLKVKDRIFGEMLAYEQALHDQIEYTHLASFLPALYNEFGS